MLTHETKSKTKEGIIVVLDRRADDVLKKFKCSACGRTVFQYYGGVKIIMPGKIEKDWLDVVGRTEPVMCRNKRKVELNNRIIEVKCKIMYYPV